MNMCPSSRMSEGGQSALCHSSTMSEACVRPVACGCPAHKAIHSSSMVQLHGCVTKFGQKKALLGFLMILSHLRMRLLVLSVLGLSTMSAAPTFMNPG